MLSAVVVALAGLCLARTLPAEPYNLRLYSQNHNNKDISSILSSIEERLRVLDTVSAVQAKQARRLDVIQDKLDRVETTLTLKLERAQLAAERLEHRLHMLQVNVQASIKESSDKIQKSQIKLSDLAQNLTHHIESHRVLLEKVNGAYADTWHRGLVLEALMRDGMSLVNVTRRELADGLRALARRQRDARHTSADLEAMFTRRLNDNTNKIDLKMQELIDKQKIFVDSCQRVQQDDPNQVANVLDKLFDSLINKIGSIFRELQNIQVTVRDHDSAVMKYINTVRTPQTDTTCRRLENAFHNTSHGIFKEAELKQLTEKFVALTDRADAALQRLEAQIGDEVDEESIPSSEVTAETEKLYNKLKETKREKESDGKIDWDDLDAGYFEDDGSDIMDEDRQILDKATSKENFDMAISKENLDKANSKENLERAISKENLDSITARPMHRRHLHKHPYDRGPKWYTRN